MCHGGRHHRNDDLAMDAVLHPGRDRREGHRPRRLRPLAIDVVAGAVFTDFIAFFIMVASAATIYFHNLQPPGRPDRRQRRRYVARPSRRSPANGPRSCSRSALLNAGIFTASILPLSTAYYVCEAFGFQAGVVNRLSRGADLLWALLRPLIVIGARLVILPGRAAARRSSSIRRCSTGRCCRSYSC